MFETIHQIIDQLNSSTSSTQKLATLKANDSELLRRVLLYSLHPFYNYGVTTKQLHKKEFPAFDLLPYEQAGDMFVFKMLDDLRNRVYTGHDAARLYWSVVKCYNLTTNDCNLIDKIISKDLQIRVGTKLINKIFPGLIPTFECKLAYPIADDDINFETECNQWLASRKLDGTRLLTIIDNDGQINCYSREGNEFFTLTKVKSKLAEYGLKGWVIDGEICIIDENGLEHFQAIMSELTRKNHTIEKPVYKIFDMVPLDVFRGEGGNDETFSKRLTKLSMFDGDETLSVVEQWKFNSKEELDKMADQAFANGWEGLILQKDVPYDENRGRTRNLLKIKKFHDAEYIVQGLASNVIRFVQDGKELSEEMVSKLIINHGGCEVGVGSGMSMAQRKLWFARPELIIGKQITVKYQDITKNKNGGVSLRFPVVKHVWENGRDT